MYDAIYRALRTIKGDRSAESNGRYILPQLAKSLCNTNSRILDVGAGYGDDLISIASRLHVPQCYAIECYPAAASHLKNAGISVSSIDVEHDSFPFDDSFFDLIVCNQVIEHIKEIFWIVSEMSRTLKVGGHILLGVPNLASLHNRIALLFGQQPPAIHVFGPHVRGFTPSGLKEFLEKGDILRVKALLGGSFYPFPPCLSRPLSRLLPTMSVSSFYIIEKIRGDGSFLDILNSPEANILVDTPYFRGGTKG